MSGEIVFVVVVVVLGIALPFVMGIGTRKHYEVFGGTGRGEFRYEPAPVEIKPLLCGVCSQPNMCPTHWNVPCRTADQPPRMTVQEWEADLPDWWPGPMPQKDSLPEEGL